MKASVAVLFYAALAFAALENVVGLQENCRMDAVSRNSPLTGTFKSRKEGAIYTCRCDSSSDCSTYYCSKDTEDEEGPVGEPVGESGSSSSPDGQTVKITVIEPTAETVEVTTEAAPADCRDSDTGIIYSFGQKFTKVGTDGQQSCVCNNDGTITCKGPLKTCPLPRSPEPEYDPAFVPPKYGCYDPWDQSWYRNYQSWDRKRLMNDVQDDEEEIFGTYRCSCSMGVTQCSARDIPCCDRSTGRFVGGGGRFLTSMSGTNYICTCRMQRGRFSDCLPERLATKSTSSTGTQGRSGHRTGGNTVPVAPTYSYRPVAQVQCRDRYRQGALYSHGQTWIQYRPMGSGQSQGWTCQCVVQGGRARTKCRYGIEYD